MPSKRDVLQSLARADLVDIAQRFDVPVKDRRSRDALVDALASTRSPKLAEMLSALTIASLKAACQALGLDSGGRQKAVMVERLVAVGVKTAPRPAPSRKKGAAEPKAAPPDKKSGRPVATKAVPKKKVAAAIRPRRQAATPAPVAAPEATAAAAGERGGAVEVAAPAAPAVPAAPVHEVAPEALTPAFGMPLPTKLQRSWFANDPPPPEPAVREVKCGHCRKKVVVRQCQAPRCDRWFVSASTSQVCSECLFERSQLTMTEFNERLHQEMTCPHCGRALKKLAESLHS